MATGNERQDEDVSTAVEDVRQRVASGAEAVRDRARTRAEDLSAGVGEHAENIAQAIRSAGETLRGREDWLAEAADGLSRNLENFSAAAREKGFDGLKRDVERLARERPAVFIGAAVTAGVALGRLLRSYPPEQRAAEEHRPDYHTASAAPSADVGGEATHAAASPAWASAQPEGGRHGSE